MGGYVGNQSRVALHDSYAKKQADASFAPITRSRKNLLINGGFDIWQRGNTSSGGWFADRWFAAPSGGTVAVSKETFLEGQTDVPGNPTHFARVDVSVANDYCSFRQRIENVRTLSGRKATLSLHGKGINPGGGEFVVRLIQFFGSGGSASAAVATVVGSVVLSPEWEKQVLTVDVPSIAGKTIDGDDHYLELDIGQNVDASTDPWTFDIAQVQLEEGDTATDFEQRSYGEELALCQRYYEINPKIVVTNTGSNTSTLYASWIFSAQKRTTPTIISPNLIDSASIKGVVLRKDIGTGGNFVVTFNYSSADAEL